MEQLGFVRKISEDMAEVEVRRISACGGGCSSCGGGCDSSKIVISLENQIGAKSGDFVEIEARPASIIKYALIAYMIPFVMLILGTILGIHLFQNISIDHYEVFGFMTGLVFLTISFLIVRLADNLVSKGNVNAMEMVRIVE